MLKKINKFKLHINEGLEIQPLELMWRQLDEIDKYNNRLKLINEIRIITLKFCACFDWM